ncbi:MAG TPA: lanthionine synthetase C family protein [Chitinophaga sp.]|uniref:lanthionine synthetase C family protein n=1 Tax=Chitinophaga sp. TaxID=1869181 RepID=UPI002DB97C32|nr:lanthionine synthetase C family protein [Chitinophaga sp.]HEU4552031.1 lanthionine synthetase C family protein [Chitinophaga sp.]
MKQVQKILAEISLALDRFTAQETTPGLLSGYSGYALFYAYYHRLTGRQAHLRKMEQLVMQMLHAMATTEMEHSHCNGIAGMAWCLQHLMRQGFIEKEEGADAFAETDKLLHAYIDEELSGRHYDFLHEGLGAVLYFLEREPDANVNAYLEKVVTHLAQAAMPMITGISWKDGFVWKHQPGNHFNLGLAHGMPAILAVLALLYERGICLQRTRALIEGGVEWLLSTRNTAAAPGISCYPGMVTADNTPIGSANSRLGWCYGDPGIAVTLWNIGVRLQNDQYKQEACRILTQVLQYRNAANGSINDAGLCHGSMGLVHIYNRIYAGSGEQVMREGMAYWLQQTLDFRTWKDGAAGFKSHTMSGKENSYNVLEGIAGIGLGLMAVLNPQAAAWDRCMLLS